MRPRDWEAEGQTRFETEGRPRTQEIHTYYRHLAKVVNLNYLLSMPCSSRPQCTHSQPLPSYHYACVCLTAFRLIYYWCYVCLIYSVLSYGHVTFSSMWRHLTTTARTTYIQQLLASRSKLNQRQ